MKMTNRWLKAVFFSCLALGVALAQQGPPAGAPGPQGRKAQRAQNMQQMRDMHDQMMKDMQADLDSMRATLKQMQDQLDKVSDPATRQELQWNSELWQKTADNMEKHMEMMKHMMGPQGCCEGKCPMKKMNGSAPPSAPPQQ
jgi:hypothetical protein